MLRVLVVGPGNHERRYDFTVPFCGQETRLTGGFPGDITAAGLRGGDCWRAPTDPGSDPDPGTPLLQA
jgi:hypothetical protein